MYDSEHVREQNEISPLSPSFSLFPLLLSYSLFVCTYCTRVRSCTVVQCQHKWFCITRAWLLEASRIGDYRQVCDYPR